MCEIKIRNVIAINDLWPSDVSEGFQNCNPVDAPTPMVTAEELGECKNKGEQGNEIRPRQLRCIWKEWIQWAQRIAFSHT